MINALVEELKASGIEENFLSIGSFLSRNKWKNLCEGRFPVEDDHKRYTLACLLEQEERFLSRMDETTRAVNIGDFQKFAFPLVRAVFPELIANDLVSVQPMLGPSSMIFYQDFVYDSGKGKVRRGDVAFSSVARGPSNRSFASPQVDDEQIAVGPTNSLANLALAWTPVVPGTLVITDGEQVITDDGLGGLTGDIGSAPGAFDYATGTFSAGATTFFSVTPTNGNPILVSYVYDAEANSKIPEMSMLITSSTVTAKRHALKCLWSLDSAFSMHALHGIEAEVEITAGAAAEIRFEIDRLIIDDLQRIAGAGSVYWNKTQPSGVGYTEHKLSLLDALQTASNLIHKVTGRGRATWIVCGEDVATAIETLPGFVETADPAAGTMKGAYKTGRLGTKWDVYKDPFYPDNFWLMGFKGPLFMHAGYAYCPWIPLYATPTLATADFVAQKGMATHFGKKPINGLFYVTGAMHSAAELVNMGVAATAADVPLFGKAGRGVFGGANS